MAVKVEVRPKEKPKSTFSKLMYSAGTDEIVLMYDVTSGTILNGNRVGMWFPNFSPSTLIEWDGCVTITNRE